MKFYGFVYVNLYCDGPTGPYIYKAHAMCIIPSLNMYKYIYIHTILGSIYIYNLMILYYTILYLNRGLIGCVVWQHAIHCWHVAQSSDFNGTCGAMGEEDMEYVEVDDEQASWWSEDEATVEDAWFSISG